MSRQSPCLFFPQGGFVLFFVPASRQAGLWQDYLTGFEWTFRKGSVIYQ